MTVGKYQAKEFRSQFFLLLLIILKGLTILCILSHSSLKTTLSRNYCYDFIDQDNRFHRRLNGLLEDTQLIIGRARIWTQVSLLQSLCTWLLHCGAFPPRKKRKNKTKLRSDIKKYQDWWTAFLSRGLGEQSELRIDRRRLTSQRVKTTLTSTWMFGWLETRPQWKW